MSAKEQAILDIKEDLKKTSKCFIAFRTKLNPVMNYLVHQQLKAQRVKSWCLSAVTSKVKEHDA